MLASAPARLADGARPLTLYWTDAWAPKSQADHIEKVSLRWLRRAWRHHREVCGDAGAQLAAE